MLMKKMGLPTMLINSYDDVEEEVKYTGWPTRIGYMMENKCVLPYSRKIWWGIKFGGFAVCL